MSAGRPSKLTKLMRRKMRMCYLRGMTDKQVAEIIDVQESTLNNWKQRYPEIMESLKDWRRHADEDVELSLYERARGYTTIETKIFSDKGIITDRIDVEKHYPPETVACIYWLKNRQPDKWRDKQELELGNKEGKKFELAYKLDE